MSLKRCPYCDELHPEGSRFCPATGQPLSVEQSICKVCGAEIQPDWNNCPECGAPIKESTSKQPATVQTWHLSPNLQPKKTTQRKKMQWKTVVGIALGGILVVMIACILGVYLLLGLHRKNQIAEILPADAPMVLSFSPNLRQLNQLYQNREVLEDVAAIFAIIPGMEDVEEAAEGDLPELDINPTTDLLPWIGPEISMAVFYEDGFSNRLFPPGPEANHLAKPVKASNYSGPPLMVSIAARSHRGAEGFLDKVRTQLERQGYTFSEQNYREVRITEMTSGFDLPIAYATFNHLVVISTDTASLIDAIDASKGDGEPILAKQEGYRQTLGELDSNRLGYFYLDMSSLIHYSEDLEELASTGFSNLNAVDHMGISFGLSEDGLKLDYALEYDLSELSAYQREALQQSQSANNLAKIVPGDSLIFWSGQDFSLSWKRTLDMIGEVFDLGFFGTDIIEEIENEFAQETGVHLTQDLIGKMNGEYAITIIPNVSSWIEGEEIPIGTIFYSEVTEPEAVGLSLQRLLGTVARETGMDFFEDSFNEVPIWQLEERIDRLELGYGFINETLFIGSPRAALRVATTGKRAPLAENSVYKASVDPLGKNRGLLFINIETLIPLIYNQMSTQEKLDFDQTIRTRIDSIQSIAYSSGILTNDTWLHGSLFIKVVE